MRLRPMITATGIAIVAIVIGGARPTTTYPSTAAGAEALLDRMANTACTLHCEYCGPGKHETTPPPSGTTADDGGEEHSCATSPQTCADHGCPESDDMVALVAAIQDMDGRSLAALARRHERLELNAERRAVQVIGCGDQVEVSLVLGQRQLQELGL